MISVMTTESRCFWWFWSWWPHLVYVLDDFGHCVRVLSIFRWFRPWRLRLVCFWWFRSWQPRPIYFRWFQSWRPRSVCLKWYRLWRSHPIPSFCLVILGITTASRLCFRWYRSWRPHLVCFRWFQSLRPCPVFLFVLGDFDHWDHVPSI